LIDNSKKIGIISMKDDDPFPDFDIVGLSDVGRVRSLNEDSFAIDDRMKLVVLADGMGGHGNGDVASRLAVAGVVEFLHECVPDCVLDFDTDAASAGGNGEEDDTIDGTESDTLPDGQTEQERGEGRPPSAPSARFHPVAVVRGAIRRANQSILARNQERGRPGHRGMGTTLVGLWLVPGHRQVVVFHAGDSRLYRLRGGALQQLTRDHSLFQAWLDSGRQGSPPARNIISRALGMDAELKPDIMVCEVVESDVFLVCSDGLTAMVPDEEIARILTGGGTLPDACAELIRKANQNGGRDNVTVVLARSLAAGKPPPPVNGH